MGEGREGGDGGSSSVGSSRCFSFRFSRGRVRELRLQLGEREREREGVTGL